MPHGKQASTRQLKTRPKHLREVPTRVRFAMPSTRLSDVGERGLLAELERRELVRGIEHDAARIDGMVVTQDALVEGVHFRLDWASWHDLGYKAAAVNLSDLAASGAEPSGLVVSLGLPPGTEQASVIELYEGLNEPSVPVIGGDTTSAERIYLSVTAVGRSDRVPGRAGARPGDRLVVTGALGGSAAEFGTIIAEATEKWAKVIKFAGVKVE